LLLRKFNLHDVKVSRVRVHAYDDRHVLTLVAFECVAVVDCMFLVILVVHEILVACANLTLPDMFLAPFVLAWFWSV
jgi:hypothetical protein